MGLDAQTELADAEVDELLERRETGVLSLARDDEPYSIPISYGYDSEERAFFFRLVSTPESEKRQFLTSSPACRIVVYDEAEPVYRSVVASGDLETIDMADLTPERIGQYGNAKRPLYEIWSESKADLDIQLFVLEPTDLEGREIDIRDA